MEQERNEGEERREGSERLAGERARRRVEGVTGERVDPLGVILSFGDGVVRAVVGDGAAVEAVGESRGLGVEGVSARREKKGGRD